jgi:Flp pilus assembly protein TadG
MRTNKRVRGQALVELAILAPWIFFLFIYAVDTGSCLVAAISVQNAARAAAFYYATTTSANATTACSVVTNQLQSLPNHSPFDASCSSGPLQVTLATSTSAPAVVTVTYQNPLPISAPPFFSGLSYQIKRTATYATRPN